MTALEGDGLRLRRAESRDADFLQALASDAEVEPFLSPLRAFEREHVLAEIDRSAAEPEEFGRFVLEVAEHAGWRLAGMIGFEVRSRHSRIATVGVVAVDARFRRQGLAAQAGRLLVQHLVLELDYHRLELECYGFNDAAQRWAESIGFVREGRRRRAYRRHGAWADGVLFGLTREDLDAL